MRGGWRRHGDGRHPKRLTSSDGQPRGGTGTPGKSAHGNSREEHRNNVRPNERQETREPDATTNRGSRQSLDSCCCEGLWLEKKGVKRFSSFSSPRVDGRSYIERSTRRRALFSRGFSFVWALGYVFRVAMKVTKAKFVESRLWSQFGQLKLTTDSEHNHDTVVPKRTKKMARRHVCHGKVHLSLRAWQ